MTWGKSSPTKHVPTGRYYKIIDGQYTGEIAEEVNTHSWGGIDLLFRDGEIATFASGDVELVKQVARP